MKIVMVARHCCIRVQKMALPLMKKGHEVHVIANKMPAFGDKYETSTLYQNHEQLVAAIKLHRDADLFHVHNEPSWYVTIIKQTLGDVPVILDVHDSMLVRIKADDPNPDRVRISVDERNNFQLADGLVFVNEPMAEMVLSEYTLKQPHCVLPSYVPGGLYRVDAWKYLGGIVYEGRVDIADELTQDMEFFSYCDYTKLADAFHEARIGFNLYTPRSDEKIQKHYQDRAMWRGSYPYDTLIRKLGRHDWGLVGNIDKHPAWEMALPNKLFEYIAAGVPVIAMNAPLCGEFVEEHGVGIAVESVEEIKERWTEHRPCRRTVAIKGKQFAMEEHIGKLEGLYDEVLDVRDLSKDREARMHFLTNRPLMEEDVPRGTLGNIAKKGIENDIKESFDILELDDEDTHS